MGPHSTLLVVPTHLSRGPGGGSESCIDVASASPFGDWSSLCMDFPASTLKGLDRNNLFLCDQELVSKDLC